MRERSVLFTKENRAKCIAGDKTQTRRVIIPQPPQEFCRGDVAAVCNSDGLWAIARSKFSDGGSGCWPPDPKPGIKPKYQVGDHLWMTEPYRCVVCQEHNNKDFEYGEFLIEYVDTKDLIKCPEELIDWWRKRWHKKSSTTISSRFMYKLLARYWFEVTGVGCEQVQDISGLDVLAEGINPPVPPNCDPSPPPDGYDKWSKESQDKWAEDMARTTVFCRYADVENCFAEFIELWDSINKKRGFGWDKNPWVFKYEFELITKN